MACEIRLLNQGGNNTGCWFLTSAPQYPVSIEYSYDQVNWFGRDVPLNGKVHNPSDMGPLFNDIYIRFDEWPANEFGEYIFTYSPTCNLNDCGEEEPCVNCATFTIHFNAVPDKPIAVELCQEVKIENLFDLANISCANYSVHYQAGSDEDVNFQLGGACNAGKGDFQLMDVAPGVYTFLFELLEGDCGDCTVEMELTIIGNADNSPVEDIVCL